jgi:hypothetical protein
MPDELEMAALKWAEETLTAFADALKNPDDEMNLTSTLELAMEDFRARIREIVKAP